MTDRTEAPIDVAQMQADMAAGPWWVEAHGKYDWAVLQHRDGSQLNTLQVCTTGNGRYASRIARLPTLERAYFAYFAYLALLAENAALREVGDALASSLSLATSGLQCTSADYLEAIDNLTAYRAATGDT